MSKNQPIMTEREKRLAAEMGKPVPASTQNKILDEKRKQVQNRVKELEQEKIATQRAKEEAARIAAIPPMSKRQKQVYEQEQQFANVPHNTFKPLPPTVDEQVEEEIKSNTSKFKEYEDSQNFYREPVYTQQSVSPMIQEDLQNLAPSTQNYSSLFKPSSITNVFKKIRVEEIPSHFITYPENAEIYVTPYSGDDIDELSNSTLTLKYILTKCMEGVYTNFDKNQITFYDALYLSYLRRIYSIDPKDNKIQIVSQCPYCSKYSTHIIDIQEQIEFEDVKVPALPINIEFSFGKLQFTFLTYGHYMKLQTDKRSEELAYQCITPCEVNTEAGETVQGELQKLFAKLIGEDKQLLTKVQELTYHGIKPINTLCQNKDCGKTYETILDEMGSLIIPFRPSDKSDRTKVSFG